MKTEIIPTILVPTFNEVKEKIRAVENYVNWVQLDVMDGVFVENKTWSNPADLKDFKTKLKLEAHLMVDKPEKIIDKWLEVADRIIIHQEASQNIGEIIEKTHKAGKQIGIALNPETIPTVLKPFFKDLDLILLMSVQPGKGGQDFQPETLGKIKALRKIWPSGNIAVDGGINSENAKEIIGTGVNILCIGNYIFKSDDIKQTIHRLVE